MSLTRLAVLVSTALIGIGLPLPATAAVATLPSTGEDSPSAVSWLERAAAAPDRVSYHGRQIITSWGPQGSSSAMLDIVHAASQGSEISVVGSASSPGAKAFVQRADHTAGPSVDGGPLTILKATYQLAYKCCTETIGRVAILVDALRADQTLAARFWIDQATGLLLQRQLFAPDGTTLVRATVFADLTIDDSEFLGHLPPMAAGEPESVGMGRVDDLRLQGWTCSTDLPGSLKLYDVHQDSSTGALQFSYSDGLFTVSLFEQRGALDPKAVTGYTDLGLPGVHVRYGMPSYAVWSSGGIVYTLVGDLPSEQLAEVVAAFPHRQPPRVTAVERIGTGLARIATWLTPMSALSW